MSAALAVAVLGALPAAVAAAPSATPTALAAAPSATPTALAAAPSATPTPKAQPAPTQAKGRPAPTAVLPTATPTPSPKPTAQPTATPKVAPTLVPTAAPTTVAAATPVQATPVPSVSPTVAPPSGAATGTIRGSAFIDANADGQFSDGEVGVAQVDIKLTDAAGLSRLTHTDDSGAFVFDGVPLGQYRVTEAVPSTYVPTTDAAQDVEVVQDTDTPGVRFGLISTDAAGVSPDSTGTDPSGDDEQIMALASVTSLPLRFAEGRDLMAQVQKRVLGDGLVWLGVPFRSQIDGGNFQYVNCGPASLTMVLAAFGLEVGPSQVRDYLNNLIDNFDTDLGTSLDVLSRIGTQAGLTPMDLYSDHGGYRNWSTDAVRWHVQQGHPVITLVKYRNLPGHTSSLSEFDHYIVISGLTPNGFIYNDAAFATTLGYGLEISDLELEYAWNNSSIPHHAVALGLAPDGKALSFPELPRKPRRAAAEDAAAARNARRLAEADEANTESAPLTLTPVLPLPSVGNVPSTTALIGEVDRWQSDPNFDAADEQPPPEADPGAPMGLSLEPGQVPTLEPRPGPGSSVPKLLALIGSAWLVWIVWSFSASVARRAPTFAVVRAAISALLAALASVFR